MRNYDSNSRLIYSTSLGSVKEHTIELQGDHRKQAELELLKLGYSIK